MHRLQRASAKFNHKFSDKYAIRQRAAVEKYQYIMYFDRITWRLGRLNPASGSYEEAGCIGYSLQAIWHFYVRLLCVILTASIRSSDLY